MATSDAQKLIVRRCLAEEGNVDAFVALIDTLLEAEADPPGGTDFFAETSALLKWKSRVNTLKEIKGQFLALHEEAKKDNYYNLNTQ